MEIIYLKNYIWEKLTALRVLKLANIKASARQFGSLSALRHLRRLDLSGNRLAGELSHLQLDQLGFLRQLNLSHNQLNRSPLKHLPVENLVALDLSHNQLNRIEFINLPQLKKWDLSSNGAIQLQDDFGGLFAMQRLMSFQYDDGSSASNQSSIPKGLRRKLFKRVGGIAALGLKMIPLAGGSFEMGCVSGKECGSDEKPVHRVTLQPFLLGATEVTFAQWDHCVANGGCSHRPDDEGWGRGNRPVINVSWKDSQVFIQWLNSLLKGSPYRLPTEAEWEYAARAGTKTKYSWGDQAPSCSKKDKQGASFNGGENSSCYYKPNGRYKGTETVASYTANSWGFYDMHGNVYEWVQDKYQGNYKNTPNDGSAWESAGAIRVLRGGSWYYTPRDLRSAYRDRDAPVDRDRNIGFRLARSPVK